jgi:hypothetical protein
MSIVRYNDIKQYWATSLFEGNSTLQNTLSQNKFQLICANVSFADPDSYNHVSASKDPLWHS